MKDKALFYATLKVASSSFTGLGLVLLGQTAFVANIFLLIFNPIIGILMLSGSIYIERFLIITYDKRL